MIHLPCLTFFRDKSSSIMKQRTFHDTVVYCWQSTRGDMMTGPPPGGWHWAKIGLLWSIAKIMKKKRKKFLPDGLNLPFCIQKEGWYAFHTKFGSLSTVGACSWLKIPQNCKKWPKLSSLKDTPPLTVFFLRQIIINYEEEGILWHGGGLLEVY